MKNIFSFFSRDTFESAILQAWRRFPLQVILVFFVTWVLLYVVNEKPEEVLYPRLILSSIVTFFLALGLSLSLEMRKADNKYLPYLAIFYWVFFYMTVKVGDSFGIQWVTYFLLHLTGFVAIVFFAPYISRISGGAGESIEYMNYFTRVAWVFLMSAIVWVSLLMLGYIAIYAVVSLFDLATYSWDSELYGNWLIIALSLIAPLYGLSVFPRVDDIDKKKYEINRFFSFLIRYVATPAIYIYFAILYAYSVKVLLHFSEWPKGSISWLVIGFSTFGYIVYIFSRPYEGEKFIWLFRKYFPYIVIPQIGMLAYAVWLRIWQYDLTMNRYFVIVFGLWLLGISLYYIISTKRSLVIIPSTLAALSLLLSVGPWSVFSYPLARQEERLIGHLTEAGMLAGDTLRPADSTISPWLSWEIASGIDYLCDIDECRLFETRFAPTWKMLRTEIDEENKKNTITNSDVSSRYNSWALRAKLKDYLKVKNLYTYNYDEKTGQYVDPEYLSYYHDGKVSMYPLSTLWYDTIAMVGDSIGSREVQVENKILYPIVSYDPEKEAIILTVVSGSSREYRLAIDPSLRSSATLSSLDFSRMTYSVEDGEYRIKVIFQNLSVKNDKYVPKDDGTPRPLGGGSGIALIKKK
jgi:hypothetical protein